MLNVTDLATLDHQPTPLHPQTHPIWPLLSSIRVDLSLSRSISLSLNLSIFLSLIFEFFVVVVVVWVVVWVVVFVLCGGGFCVDSGGFSVGGDVWVVVDFLI